MLGDLGGRVWPWLSGSARGAWHPRRRGRRYATKLKRFNSDRSEL